MCDGVTQGQMGMELSLFSRDVIAMAAGIALSHNTFDAASIWVSAIKSCLVWLWPQAHSGFAQHLFARGSHALWPAKR